MSTKLTFIVCFSKKSDNDFKHMFFCSKKCIILKQAYVLLKMQTVIVDLSPGTYFWYICTFRWCAWSIIVSRFQKISNKAALLTANSTLIPAVVLLQHYKHILEIYLVLSLSIATYASFSVATCSLSVKTARNG